MSDSLSAISKPVESIKRQDVQVIYLAGSLEGRKRRAFLHFAPNVVLPLKKN